MGCPRWAWCAVHTARETQLDGTDALNLGEGLPVAIGKATSELRARDELVDAVYCDLKETLNPEMLARPHLEAGRLVELVPRAPLDVQLHWQHVRLAMPTMERLAAAVVAEARARLRP